MKRTRQEAPYATGGVRDVPIYRGTRCTVCGVDERVAVRHLDSVLCLNCHRTAARAARERRRRLEALLSATVSDEPTAVGRRRLARLCAVVDAAPSGTREQGSPRALAAAHAAPTDTGAAVPNGWVSAGIG